MKLNLFSKIIFAVLLAFTVNSFVYFGFANIYSSKIFTYQSFQEQFHSGIYQYRILSGYFLIWIYDFLSILNIDYNILKLKFLSANSEPQMYLSFYLLNTFFIMLSAIILTLITESKNFIATNSEKILITSVAIFSIALSQFVVVPYDIPSYFFILLFFYCFIGYLEKQSVSKLILLSAVIIISTFNRESSALSLSLAATLLYAKFGMRKETFLPVIVLGTAFVSVYSGLRLMSDNFTTNDGNLFIQNFTQLKNILGLLFWLVFFTLPLVLAKDQKTVKLILVFHLLSVPYLLLCFYTGILYEIRLYIPLLITSLSLSRTELTGIH
ncbi:hypothetical protein [Chryseobacterium sp. MDT2-18]|uniref:hypothetical protein n=1 Tax=Chryseobacterium sp. MDT2-18 TaxID=1259136 RepID=UPI0027852A8D|nr:hypothetical protein [Chryseobacterium sp. MDT2-18]MDQ0476570.1 membrane-associated HD superfamily phosphohydrolase [Chryseobacterium sp. MDT2-18]